jgi:hypothetical protein
MGVRSEGFSKARVSLSISPPYRSRAEGVLAHEWEDIDFENLSMKDVRAVVHGLIKMEATDPGGSQGSLVVHRGKLTDLA